MRIDPRITATKLSEYMGATYARKRAILQEQKFPQAFAMARWVQAERPIARFVADSSTDLGIIDQDIAALSEETPDTEFKIQNRALCIEALESFKHLSNQLSFPTLTRMIGPFQKNMPIPVNGVAVSVLPQVLLSGVTSKGTKIVGGIKFSFPRSFPLTQESAGFLAVLIHWHCEHFLAKMGKADLRLCYAVDIPTSNIFTPPQTYKRRRQQIQEACHEIAQRWPNLPEPNGYQE